MSGVVQRFPNIEPTKPADQVQIEQTIALVRTLVGTLPTGVKVDVLRDLLQGAERAEAGPTGVIADIIKFAKRGDELTAAEVRKVVADRGIEAEPKEVYNSLTYLARAGKLTRVGYGRYIVSGVEFTTAEDLPLERDRHEDLADDGP